MHRHFPRHKFLYGVHTRHMCMYMCALSLSLSHWHTYKHTHTITRTHSRRSLNSVTCPGSVSCYCLFNRLARALQLKSLLCNITVLSELCVWPSCHSDGPGRQASRLVCSQYLQWQWTQREVSRSREGARFRAIDVRLGFHSLFILHFSLFLPPFSSLHSLFKTFNKND